MIRVRRFDKAASRHPHVYLICGCPRSGTTWLHNLLIDCGRFRGKRAEDAGPVSHSLWATDENRYVHALLLRLNEYGSGVRAVASEVGLSLVRAALKAKYGDGRSILLKSPYFCFFLDLMYRRGLAGGIVFVRRNIDSVASSIVTHGNLGVQISGSILSFSAMSSARGDFESEWMPESVKQEFFCRYAELSKFDRAMYKALCFVCAFLALKKDVPAEAIFVLNYDSVAEDERHRREFCDFIGLSVEQERMLIRSYAPSRVSSDCLPQYDSGFRNLLLETEASLWSGSN